MTGHNPLIFLGKPGDQFKMLKTGMSGMEELDDALENLLDSSEAAGDISDDLRKILDRRRGTKEQREKEARDIETMTALYEEAAEMLRAHGVYDLALDCFGVLPVAPKFDLAMGEYGPDAPHRSKLLGIPDFRGDFLLTHPRVMKEHHKDGDDLPEWANRTLEDTIAELWPHDPNGGYMKFAAQVRMPSHLWRLLYAAGARKQRDRYNEDEYWVSTPMGHNPLSMTSNYAYVFHSREWTYSPQLNAYVDFSQPGDENDVVPWDEYVEAVKRAIPAECYTDEDMGLVSAALEDPKVGLEFDFGQDYPDSTSGADRFWREAKALKEDAWSLAYDNEIGEAASARGVTIGGRPSSQQEEKRPWDPMSYGGPRRMVPFFTYWAEHDVTHQIYLSAFRGEGSAYWGADEASCT
jgi:hypothetical protein